MKDIKITEAKIEFHDGDISEIEIIYIPDQTQVLEKGKRYRFVLDVSVEKGEGK